MSTMEWSSWLSDLEGAIDKESFLSSKIRSGSNISVLSGKIRELQMLVHSLSTRFKTLEPKTSAFSVTPDELTRRRMLLNQLKHDQQVIQDAFNSRANNSKNKSSQDTRDLLGLQTQIMRDQDSQLEDISKGVSNLHNYSLTVKNESELHVKLLDGIGSDVDHANIGLEAEGNRAQKVAQQSSHFKLYLTIVILTMILIFLLMAGAN